MSTDEGGAPNGGAHPDSTTERLEAFSDGVLAIAITLLVLNIKIPTTAQGELWDTLVDRWPSYIAYVLSFTVIGIMWVSHHSMFERIRHVDRGLLFANLLLLLFIGFLPFPTSLLADYTQQGGSNAQVAAAAYSATMTGIGLAFTGIWLYLERNPRLLVPGVDPTNLRRSVHRSLVGPLVYLLTIPLAFVSVAGCYVVYALVAVYFMRGPSSRALRATSPTDDV